MFQVKRLPDGCIFRVYGQSGLIFLVWNDYAEVPHWDWIPIEQCVPLEEKNAHGGNEL